MPLIFLFEEQLLLRFIEDQLPANSILIARGLFLFLRQGSHCEAQASLDQHPSA